ncbi:MAG: DUF4369 domain-containing protein [Bacteroidetes bacterium]|nr:DUF4369 domain-containing protein [Bacteroidota bacterium]
MQKIILFLLTLLLLSCNNKNKIPADSFCIEGKITNADKHKFLLQKITIHAVIPVDSVSLDKEGKFSFIIKSEEKGIYMLTKDANHFISFIADKGEHIFLETDYEKYEKTYSIKGNRDSELLSDLNNHLQPNLHKLDSIGKIWETAVNMANRVEIKRDLDSCYYKILDNQREFQLNFVKNNSSSLAAIIALYQPLNRDAVIKEESDFPLFEKVSIDLLKVLPMNTHAIDFAKRIKQHKMMFLEKKLLDEANAKNKH